MSDLRVLFFFYMVEPAMIILAGMALIGIRLSWRQVATIGILEGLVVYLVRGIYTIYQIPFGTHTVFILLGLIVISRYVTRNSWGISTTAGLLGFILLLLSESLMLPVVFEYMTITLEKVLEATWMHIAMGYLGDWLLILVTVYLRFSKKFLINVENLES